MTTMISLHSRDAQFGKEQPYLVSWITDLDLQGYFQHVSVKLDRISFPNAVPPVNRFNNTIQFFHDRSTLETVLIPEGIYSGSQLATAVQTAMNSISGSSGYVVTYDATTKKLTFDAGIYDSEFRSGTTANYVLGLTANQLNVEYGTSPSTTLTGNATVNISGSQFLYVCSNLGTSNSMSKGRRDMLEVVDITAPFGSVNYWVNQTEDYMPIKINNLETIEISLFDENLNYYTLPEGTEIHLVLKFKFS